MSRAGNGVVSVGDARCNPGYGYINGPENYSGDGM